MADKDFSDEIIVEDGEDYKGAEALGIKIIALEQYRRCCVEGSKEMCKGGIERRFIKGVETEVVIPNQREIFINSVKMLSILLSPELNSKIQTDILDELKEIDEEITKLNEDTLFQLVEEKKQYQRYKYNKPKEYLSVIKSIKIELSEQKEKDLVICFQNKLIKLSQSLKELNYFDEGIATGGS